MIYDLITEGMVNKKFTRTYRNKQGTEVKTHLVYTDTEGGKWFAFLDLYKIPIQRKAMASYVTNLYSVGLTIKDILTWCSEEKKLINGNDPEKLQKLYALILDKEKLATFTADPIKQGLALAAVYIMSQDERIDTFENEDLERKLKIWGGMPEAVGFFLKWLNSHIEYYINRFSKASQTASKLQGIN